MKFFTSQLAYLMGDREARANSGRPGRPALGSDEQRAAFADAYGKT